MNLKIRQCFPNNSFLSNNIFFVKRSLRRRAAMELFDTIMDPRDAILINDLISSTESEQDQSFNDESIDIICRDDAFYFVLPDDTEYLTDYHMLLFGQVRRGVLNYTDQAKANRSGKFNVGFRGMRCRHCGGNEKVNQASNCDFVLTCCRWSTTTWTSNFVPEFRVITSQSRPRTSKLAQRRFTHT